MRRKWRSYSLRTLLLSMATFAILLSLWLNRVRTQARIISELQSIGAGVYSIDYSEGGGTVILDYPSWLPSSWQFVYPSRKNTVVLPKDFDDNDVVLAIQLPNLEVLEMDFGTITDESLNVLHNSSSLIQITLFHTKGYSEDAVERFLSANPKCDISR